MSNQQRLKAFLVHVYTASTVILQLLSVDLLHQSVAVEVDCTQVVPITHLADGAHMPNHDRLALSAI